MRETSILSLGGEGSLKEEMAAHSSILAWRIPWTEEPGGLQAIGSQRETTEQLNTHIKVLLIKVVLFLIYSVNCIILKWYGLILWKYEACFKTYEVYGQLFANDSCILGKNLCFPVTGSSLLIAVFSCFYFCLINVSIIEIIADGSIGNFCLNFWQLVLYIFDDVLFSTHRWRLWRKMVQWSSYYFQSCFLP